MFYSSPSVWCSLVLYWVNTQFKIGGNCYEVILCLWFRFSSRIVGAPYFRSRVVRPYYYVLASDKVSTESWWCYDVMGSLFWTSIKFNGANQTCQFLLDSPLWFLLLSWGAPFYTLGKLQKLSRQARSTPCSEGYTIPLGVYLPCQGWIGKHVACILWAN